MGFGDDNYKQQQAGYKGLERFDITIRVIETIDLMGDLYTMLRFRGINRETQQVWEAFLNSFFKLFHITALLLPEKDLDLITDIEASFSASIDLNPETSNRFLTHFADYLAAMKKAGVYDPSVVRQFWNPAAAWEKSI